MNSQLAHDDCRRIRRCERSRWPWPSLQFCSQCYRSRIWRNIMTLHVCKHSNLLCSVIFVNFCNFFQQWHHYVVTCQLSAQEIVNWVTTADGCVHAAGATVLSCRRCVHTADTTQLDSFVASASAVCIGHNGSCWFLSMAVLILTAATRVYARLDFCVVLRNFRCSTTQSYAIYNTLQYTAYCNAMQQPMAARNL